MFNPSSYTKQLRFVDFGLTIFQNGIQRVQVWKMIIVHFGCPMFNIDLYTFVWPFCMSKLAPAGFAYEGSCTLRVYTHYFGMMGGILGLLLAPYIPSFREKMCFLDVVSIHQADQVYMQRGIYAIGGFLAVSAELQILWDRPYLYSSL